MKSQLIFLTVLIMIVPLFSIAQVKIPVKKKVERKTEKEANEAVDKMEEGREVELTKGDLRELKKDEDKVMEALAEIKSSVVGISFNG